MGEMNVLGNALQAVAQAGLAQEKPKEFVQRLMVAKCDKGTLKYQYLNLPKDHGVYFQDLDHPLMNANDHKADRHILQFGRCTAETNPKNVAGKVLSATVPLFNILDKAKSAMGCDGCKCSPKTLKVWEETNEGNCLDGANGILNTSHAMCIYGGFIEITEEPAPEKSEDADQSGEEAPSRKPIEQQLPAAMAEKINSLNPTEESGGEDSATAEGSDAAGQDAPSAGAGAPLSGGDSGSAGASGGAGGGMDAGAAGDDSPAYTDSGMGDIMPDLTEDMNQWYAGVQDFPQSYGVSDKAIRSNYANNMCMPIPKAALNDGGYICDMGGLSAFRMGGSSAALIGGSCVAAYNLLNAVGMKPDLGRLIMSAERQQTIPGFMDQGPMAVSMLSTKNTLSRMGVSAKPMNPNNLMKAVRTPGTTAILATARKGMTPEYHTLKSDKKGKFQCLDRAADVSTLMGKQEGVVKMALVVRKKGVNCM